MPFDNTLVETRDYSLTGPSSKHAIEHGLASAQWYHPDVPKKEMRALMRRKDGPAIRDTAIWFGLLVLTALGGVYFWGTWACVPFWVVYGVLYGSACDSRWHEAGHGTAFKTRWMNNVVYQVASFMVMRNPVSWRWSHYRHHSDTLIVGRDPEIAFMHPANLLLGVLHFVGIVDAWASLKVLTRNAIGTFSADERDYIPQSDLPKATLWARIHMLIYVATGIAAIWMGSVIPLMIIGLPRLYGCWHMYMTGLIQHGGLAEDVLDHRLNSRTVLMNPISRWIYWNMNYHVEHHMFPLIPYYNLPAMHELIKNDLPAPCPSIFAAYAEMVPAVIRQRHEKGYYLRKELPPTAKPYKEEFHQLVPTRE